MVVTEALAVIARVVSAALAVDAAALAADISVDSGVNGMTMMKKFIALTVMAVAPVAQVYAQSTTAIPRADVSTEAMVKLCQDKDDVVAQTFCFGFGEGVYQANLVNPDSKIAPKVCIPEKGTGVSREEVLAEFIKWAQANPQYNKEYAALTVLRYLPIRFPCKG